MRKRGDKLINIGGFGVVPLIVVVIALAFWLWMLIDCLKRPDEKFAISGNYVKQVWVLVIFFTPPIGALLYYFAIKRKD